MTLTIRLPIRDLATLDTALAFFRAAPAKLAPARQLARHCQYLHDALASAGIQGEYTAVGVVGEGRPLLRLRIKSVYSPRQVLALQLPGATVRGLVRACLIILEVQTEAVETVLLGHEVEELQAIRSFFSVLRRQGLGVKAAAPRRARPLLRWREDREEYGFTRRIALRVQKYYLRAGMSVN
jgi:hypothetical protein